MEWLKNDAVDVEPGQYSPEQLRAVIKKGHDGGWYGIAFIELPDQRLIVSIVAGKKPKQVTKEVMKKALLVLQQGSNYGGMEA